jgi:transcriptional regulator with XRE-family HTH domain
MDEVEALLERARRRRETPDPAWARMLRQRAGLTQEEVAALLGVTGPEVCRYENNQRRPRGAVRDRYFELLDRLARESA